LRERPPFLLFLAGFFWLRRLERRRPPFTLTSALITSGDSDSLRFFAVISAALKESPAAAAAASSAAASSGAAAASSGAAADDSTGVSTCAGAGADADAPASAIFLIVSYTYSQYFILPILRINSTRFSTPASGTRFLPNIHASTHPLRGKSAKYSAQSFHSGCFFICSFTENGVPHGGPQCAKNDIWRMDALSATFVS
jgi:hypothetical protein